MKTYLPIYDIYLFLYGLCLSILKLKGLRVTRFIFGIKPNLMNTLTWILFVRLCPCQQDDHVHTPVDGMNTHALPFKKRNSYQNVPMV